MQTGIGDKLAAFFQWITTFIAGLVIGFAIDYRLTLVILAVTPFIVVAAFIMGKVRHLYIMYGSTMCSLSNCSRS